MLRLKPELPAAAGGFNPAQSVMGTWEHWGAGGGDNTEAAPGAGAGSEPSPCPCSPREQPGSLCFREDGIGLEKWSRNSSRTALKKHPIAGANGEGRVIPGLPSRGAGGGSVAQWGKIK